MKRALVLNYAVLGLVMSVQTASADIFEGLNKAADTVNRVNAATQVASTNVDLASQNTHSLKSIAAQQLMSRTLESNIEPGVTSKAQLIEMLGQPVKSKIRGKAQTLTFGVTGAAEKLEAAQAIAGVMGVETPKLAGDVIVLLKNDRVDSFSVANFSAE